ncbi:hypothetical protein OSB04_002581 [Centaurea solstitialis]|uniref:Uncharacterized protein n=1 Tax=Centaurea solstitialis TaxID=347529 RepID=A0AA38WTA5_9ASTR|nr:hypothetical protein OSB04_002581 [Centaurea solstitialis]
MSKEILGIGSETRPPVLVMGEYQQWKRRMIHFLDMLDGNLMKSIREGPIRPTVTVAAVPKTDTCPELPSYVVEKPVEMFNPEQRARHLVDKRALTLLIMALPNDMYPRVDSLTNARDVWLEIEQQMQGGDTALESQKESALNAYEGFKARETESLTESYQRLNAFVNDLRRLGIEKSKYEVNVKFLKNLTPAWQNLAINLQLSRNLGIMGLHDLFSMMVQHEEFITGGKFKNTVDPLALAAVPCAGSNSAPFQHQQYNNSSPQQYNQSPPQHYQENYNQEFNGNYGSNYQEFNSNYSPSYQHQDDPLIISISDDELFHVNESLALISNSVQKLNSKRGYSRPRGSGYPSGGRMGQGRGGHYQQERVQFGNQGRGGYQLGGEDQRCFLYKTLGGDWFGKEECENISYESRLGEKRVELLQKGGLLGTFDFKPFSNCESCLSGKMTKKPFNKDNERANDLIEIIHTDVCGPFSHEARGGYRYFITFTDDFSRYGYVYLMRHKSEAFEKFKEFQSEVLEAVERKSKEKGEKT